MLENYLDHHVRSRPRVHIRDPGQVKKEDTATRKQIAGRSEEQCRSCKHGVVLFLTDLKLVTALQH
jgi:hypothetical protein